jgi:hypothetical protein
MLVLLAVMFALSLGGTLLTTSGKTDVATVPHEQTNPLSPVVPSR